MSSTHEIVLTGCTPEPLMNYLKALGILRLVSEQVDSNATGCWRNDVFVLQTELKKNDGNDELVNFFLEKYKPTPILAPWNSGCGFYQKWDPDKKVFKERDVVEALGNIESSTNKNLLPYRDQIKKIKNILKKRSVCIDLIQKIDFIKKAAQQDNLTEKQCNKKIKEYLDNSLLFELEKKQYEIEKAEKDDLLSYLRNDVLNDQSILWLDTAFVVRTGQKKNRIEAPLLGSGGNIGNSDFSSRFMQILGKLLPFQQDDTVPDNSKPQLITSLYSHSKTQLLNYSVDQFYPGKAGKANMGQGFDAISILNPWDYIFMLEGSLLISGNSSRRLNSRFIGSSFPFSVDSSNVGFASSGPDDTRGEIWLPMWENFATLNEISYLLGEGRSELGKRKSRNGVEFARSVVNLGIDRGLNQFVRIQYQKRLGENYLANALGRFHVHHHEDIQLINEIGRWLEKNRVKIAHKKANKRYKPILRKIESSLFDYCKYGKSGSIIHIIHTMGIMEKELCITKGVVRKENNNEVIVNPIQDLSVDWIESIQDGTVDFEIALSLAGIHHHNVKHGLIDYSKNIGSIRANLEPIIEKSKSRLNKIHWNRCEKDNNEKNKIHTIPVWSNADLCTNLMSILERRLLDGSRACSLDIPLHSRSFARLDSISTFIAGEIDDHRIEELLWGLILIDHHNKYPKLQKFKNINSPPLPRSYALLKLMFLPKPLLMTMDEQGHRHWRFVRKKETGLRIGTEPRILPLLRAGRIGEACRIAYRRLLVSGIQPLPGPGTNRYWREEDWEREYQERTMLLDPMRLAASLLFPINDKDVNTLINTITRANGEALAIAAVSEGEMEL